MALFQNVHRGARISPKKVQPLVTLIRGMRIDEAEATLRLSKKRAAVLLLAGLRAARANADQKEADIRRLVVADCRVDSGPTMKRFREKDRGRAHPILKRTSHIIVAVEER